jgi:hypothetical protein
MVCVNHLSPYFDIHKQLEQVHPDRFEGFEAIFGRDGSSSCREAGTDWRVSWTFRVGVGRVIGLVVGRWSSCSLVIVEGTAKSGWMERGRRQTQDLQWMRGRKEENHQITRTSITTT